MAAYGHALLSWSAEYRHDFIAFLYNISTYKCHFSLFKLSFCLGSEHVNMVSRPARSVPPQIRLRRRIHFNAAVPPDPFHPQNLLPAVDRALPDCIPIA